MATVLRWLLVIGVVGFLAYASLFSLVPLAFLAGGAALTLIYLVILALVRRRSGTWAHARLKGRFTAVMLVYVALYWIVIGLFTGVETEHTFWARYEPLPAPGGGTRGHVFHYIDFPGSYERIVSAEVDRYLAAQRPDRVRLLVETTTDFRVLRAYSVESVDGIPVNEAWSGGSPPWGELRRLAAAR